MVRSYDKLFTEEQKKSIIDDYVNNNLSYRKLEEKYNIKSTSFLKKLLKGHVRSAADANRLAYKLCPSRFKHTEESKRKLREARLAYIKANPGKSVWPQRSISYPEKIFINFLKHYEYDNNSKIIREYCVFPYFIDFAFIDEKLAIEVDGSQHLYPDRREKDTKKEEMLISQGWTVLRFTENLVKTDWDAMKEAIDNSLKNKTNTVIRLGQFSTNRVMQIEQEIKDFDLENNPSNFDSSKKGLFKHVRKTWKKVEKDEFGHTEKEYQSYYNQRKVKDRPSAEQLLDMFRQGISMRAIGKLYGVSDRAVAKWCRRYNI